MTKCITCGKPLGNTDFYCSMACAFKGIQSDAAKLEKLIEEKLPDNLPNEEDLEFSKACQMEKHDMQYINNPSL